jgi:ATP-binding cassette, subfamily A (ABC1), member 3
VDKQERCEDDRLLGLVRQHVPDVVVERQSAAEMVLGVRRNQSKQIGQLIRALDAQSEQIGVDSYGLSMTSIEQVFLK